MYPGKIRHPPHLRRAVLRRKRPPARLTPRIWQLFGTTPQFWINLQSEYVSRQWIMEKNMPR